MKVVFRRECKLAGLLIAISLFVLAPITTNAASPPQARAITINATGQAARLTNNGPSGPATLTIKAFAYNDSNKVLQIQNTTGMLQIGSMEYSITNGHGSVRLGNLFIVGNTKPYTAR